MTTGYCSRVGSNLVTKSEEHVTSSHVDEVFNMLIMWHLDVEISRFANLDRLHDDRRLSIGYCPLVGTNFVNKTEKHDVRSSAKAEYHPVAHGEFDLLRLNNLLIELKGILSSSIKLHVSI